MYLHFDEIIDLISVAEMENPQLSGEREKNIALFARFIANGHVGWNTFSEEDKNKFRKGVEDLYNKNPETNENILLEMETLLIQSIPDNHTFILDQNKNEVLSREDAQNIPDKVIDKYPEGHVGKNTAYTLESNSSVNVLCRQGTKDFPILIIEKDVDEKKVGVVSLSKCPQPSDTAYNIEEFRDVFEKNYQNWDAVVLDVRGNEGGNSHLLNSILEKLYGNKIGYYRTQEMRMTPEAKILQAQKIKSCEFLDQLHKNNPNGYKSKEKKEPEFNTEKGFNNNIYVLLDRQTSSSAEFVCGLYNHPKIKYLGENSCGCGEYGDTGQLQLPNGGYLNMGVYKNELHSGIKEGIGFSPTHATEVGRDAFEHCLSVIERDFYIQNIKNRIKGAKTSLKEERRECTAPQKGKDCQTIEPSVSISLCKER